MALRHRVIIIGAGMAGLSSAECLVTSGLHDVIILEASDRYGGRMKTVQFGEGIVELGANWIHGATLNNSIYTLAAQNNLLQPYVLLDRMEGYCYTSDGKVIDPKLSQKVWDFFHGFDDNNQAHQPNPTGTLDTWLETHIEKSLKQFSDHERPQARAVFNCLVNLERFHDGGSLDRVSTRQNLNYEELPGGEVKLPYGCQALLVSLVKRLPEGVVKLNMKVSNICVNNGENCVKIVCESGAEFIADYVIVTGSLGFLKKNQNSLFTPPLSRNKVNAIDNMGFGCVNKVFLYYDNPFWVRGKGGIKLCWSDKEVRNQTTDEWYKRIFAFDEVLNNPGVLVAWVSGDEAAYMETLPLEKVANDCSRIIKQFLGNPHLPEPARVVRSQWNSNPNVCGSYSFMTNGNFSLGDLQEPVHTSDGVPRLLFAGEATHPKFFSTMHGARSSGLREARRILRKSSLLAKL